MIRGAATLLVLLACAPAQAGTAAGKHWRLSLDAIGCESAGSVLALSVGIRYAGPKGPVEAPVIQLADAAGRSHLPRSLAWKRGSRETAQWLSSGGIANLQSEEVGEVQIRFDPREASGELKLELGDIPAFAVARSGTGDACRRLLKPGEVGAAAPRPRGAAGKSALRVYRGAYPCTAGNTVRTVEADHPPQLPRQLVVFGRGYLPAVRQVELPMGKAPAQAYAYVGPADLGSLEAAAKRALAADFPQYSAPKHFAFNWGVQKARSGNEMESIAVYEHARCPN